MKVMDGFLEFTSSVFVYVIILLIFNIGTATC